MKPKGPGRIYLLYMVAIFVWNFLIFLTPYLASAGGTGATAANLLYSFFSYICHQNPTRSFFLFGQQMPVCARDTAIYLGMLIGGLALPLVQDPSSRRIPPLWIFVLAMIPIGLDGMTQLFGWRESTNLIRSITGGIMGLTIPFYLIPVLNFFSWKLRHKIGRTR